MPQIQPSRSLPSSLALLIGVLLVLVAFVLAEFVTFPSTGHRIDTTKWPAEAQSILAEKPGVRISSEQWKRIDKVLLANGDINFGQRPYWSQTVRASWWWFVIVPLLATAIAKFNGRGPSMLSTALLASPSVLALVAGLALSASAA